MRNTDVHFDLRLFNEDPLHSSIEAIVCFSDARLFHPNLDSISTNQLLPPAEAAPSAEKESLISQPVEIIFMTGCCQFVPNLLHQLLLLLVTHFYWFCAYSACWLSSCTAKYPLIRKISRKGPVWEFITVKGEDKKSQHGFTPSSTSWSRGVCSTAVLQLLPLLLYTGID